MNSTIINVKNISSHQLPQYATENSSGVDVRAYLNEKIELKPLQRFAIPTGIFLEIPIGYEAQVRPRSGLALKNGITCLNSPGTIDADYRGEVKVILINLSNETQIIENGDRIAQLVFAKVEHVAFVNVDESTQTKRGEGGFGHTGTK